MSRSGATLFRIRIETDFPLYRIQSGRTHRAQSAYLDQHPHIGKDFFEDPEDPKVQKAQHEILLNLISERELDADLEERGQRAPLVLTFDGYVSMVIEDSLLCARQKSSMPRPWFCPTTLRV